MEYEDIIRHIGGGGTSQQILKAIEDEVGIGNANQSNFYALLGKMRALQILKGTPGPNKHPEQTVYELSEEAVTFFAPMLHAEKLLRDVPANEVAKAYIDDACKAMWKRLRKALDKQFPRTRTRSA